MPGTFFPPPRVSDPDMHHGTCMTHVPYCMPGSLTSGFLWSRWQVKRSRHSRRMHNPQFYVSGERSIDWMEQQRAIMGMPGFCLRSCGIWLCPTSNMSFGGISSFSSFVLLMDEWQSVKCLENTSGQATKLYESGLVVVPSTSGRYFTLVQNHPYCL